MEYTIKEAAEKWGIPPNTILAGIRKGKLNAVKRNVPMKTQNRMHEVYFIAAGDMEKFKSTWTPKPKKAVVGYPGISFYSPRGTYRATAFKDGQVIFLKESKSLDECKQAIDEYNEQSRRWMYFSVARIENGEECERKSFRSANKTNAKYRAKSIYEGVPYDELRLYSKDGELLSVRNKANLQMSWHVPKKSIPRNLYYGSYVVNGVESVLREFKALNDLNARRFVARIYRRKSADKLKVYDSDKKLIAEKDLNDGSLNFIIYR